MKYWCRPFLVAFLFHAMTSVLPPSFHRKLKIFPLVYRIAFFFVGSKIRSLTAQNEYFSARPARVRRGVVHVRAQETKIKLTKIHIFCAERSLTERKKKAIR